MSGLVERLLSAAGFKPFYSRDDDKFVNDIAKARHEITRDDYGPSWLAIKSNHRGNIRREIRTTIDALLTCGYFPLAQSDMREAADEIERLTARVAELEGALAWYGEQARLARLIHSGGDAGRAAIADDGGKRAKAALEAKS